MFWRPLSENLKIKITLINFKILSSPLCLPTLSEFMKINHYKEKGSVYRLRVIFPVRLCTFDSVFE